MQPARLTRSGCEVTGIARGARVRVLMAARAAPEPDERTAREWAQRAANNPRLFDGAIVAVDSIEISSSNGDVTIGARHDRYQRLAVQPMIDNGVRLLAARGVVSARDRRGVEHVFVGQRDARTLAYGEMWELGPSGGIQPPRAGVRELSFADLIALYGLELREEAGLEIARALCEPLAICDDVAARGVDVVIRLSLASDLEAIERSSRDWEYSAVRWVAVREFARFAEGVKFSPPSVAIAAMLGWVR